MRVKAKHFAEASFEINNGCFQEMKGVSSESLSFVTSLSSLPGDIVCGKINTKVFRINSGIILECHPGPTAITESASKDWTPHSDVVTEPLELKAAN